jgi:hypothetical protein
MAFLKKGSMIAKRYVNIKGASIMIELMAVV